MKCEKNNSNCMTIEEYLLESSAEALSIAIDFKESMSPILENDLSNPFDLEETLFRIQRGGFSDYGDFIQCVSFLKLHDLEAFKCWWINDGTKSGAIKILSETNAKNGD